ncbi:hypothetical protein FF38_00285 [Lucilia cuprina]|uniref:Uncharacterized protein n=1 Tax=Lucilia cuprina TaxID=7375 RepID=A0A0L0BLI2_LUCCU|nr:hypothetical protein FF38_00285 [Lucilia cuprina]
MSCYSSASPWYDLTWDLTRKPNNLVLASGTGWQVAAGLCPVLDPACSYEKSEDIIKPRLGYLSKVRYEITTKEADSLYDQSSALGEEMSGELQITGYPIFCHNSANKVDNAKTDIPKTCMLANSTSKATYALVACRFDGQATGLKLGSVTSCRRDMEAKPIWSCLYPEKYDLHSREYRLLLYHAFSGQ